jgi:tetratricopeptide (TPR) repeat protein
MIELGVPDKAPLFATLHAERANAMYRLGRHEEALRDCARAIYAKDDCRRAWLVKRLALHGLGRHEEALREMETLTQGWGANDATVRHARERAEFELRKSKRPDYYALLQCRHVASENEIKAAYAMPVDSLAVTSPPPFPSLASSLTLSSTITSSRTFYSSHEAIITTT